MLRLISFFAILLAAIPAFTRDVYVMGMHARGSNVDHCNWLSWRADVLFYNTSLIDARVRLVGVSNGESLPGPYEELTVPARSLVSVQRTAGTYWYPKDPRGLAPLWMWRIEAPDVVEVHSQMELFEESCANAIVPTALRGQLTLPTFEKLIPAHQEQIFLGTDLGEMERRVNVAIYNPASAPATARIALHRGCDGSIVASETVVIPPNTVVQKSRLHSGAPPNDCPSPRLAVGSYVVVTVDQPSIAFVSALSNTEATILTHNFVATGRP